MDAFKYVALHDKETTPTDALKKSLSEMQKTNLQMVEGLNDFCKSGIMNTKEIQEITPRMFSGWKK